MAVTLHQGMTFVVSDDRGDFEPSEGEGLFHLDTRFLSLHQLRVDGQVPILLQRAVPCTTEALHFLTNPALDGAGRSTLGIVLRRELGRGFRESIQIENFSGDRSRFELTLSFDSDFQYILTVKQRMACHADDGSRPQVQREVRGSREALLAMDEGGAPHRTAVTFDPAPDVLGPGEARFKLELAPRERWHASLEVSPSLGDGPARAAPATHRDLGAEADRRRAEDRVARVVSDHPVLARAFEQASRDLTALRIKAEGREGEDGGGGHYAIAAGIPWYMDLFGRDSLIASYQAMIHEPGADGCPRRPRARSCTSTGRGRSRRRRGS